MKNKQMKNLFYIMLIGFLFIMLSSGIRVESEKTNQNIDHQFEQLFKEVEEIKEDLKEIQTKLD